MKENTINRLTLITVVCMILFGFLLFYYFGYNINGEWKMVMETIPFDNPFFYILVVFLLLSFLSALFLYGVKRNEGKVDKKAFLGMLGYFIILNIVLFVVNSFL